MPMNVNGRILLIIAGLALPIVVLGVLTFHMKSHTTASNVAAPSAIAIGNAKRAIAAEKAFHQKRLNELNSMTDADWPKDAIKNPHHESTREAAIAYQTNALARLARMTPQQWLALHEQEEMRRERWEAWRKSHPPKPVPPRTMQNNRLPPITR